MKTVALVLTLVLFGISALASNTCVASTKGRRNPTKKQLRQRLTGVSQPVEVVVEQIEARVHGLTGEGGRIPVPPAVRYKLLEAIYKHAQPGLPETGKRPSLVAQYVRDAKARFARKAQRAKQSQRAEGGGTVTAIDVVKTVALSGNEALTNELDGGEPADIVILTREAVMVDGHLLAQLDSDLAGDATLTRITVQESPNRAVVLKRAPYFEKERVPGSVETLHFPF